MSFYVSIATFCLLNCDEWDRVVALPRHKFVTGATLLQLAVTVKIPSHTIVVYIELVHKDPFEILLAELLSDPLIVYI